jgi:hypothetical protein
VRTHRTSGPLSAQAIAGSHVVILGIDYADDAKALDGLLGFGIERLDHTEGKHRWLPNRIRFPGVTDPGTNFNPLQTFLWGDYTAEPAHNYTYKIHALDGVPGTELHSRASVVLHVHTQEPSVHGVWFNRGVIASQAYADHFQNRDPRNVPNREAWKWLSRGLEEALLAFIGQAMGDEWSLRGTFYEFRHPSVITAFDVARQGGADVQLIVDDVAANHSAALPIEDLVVLWRKKAQIPHNKFVVAVRNGEPKSVWTGSTNITENGIFGQLNVGHRLDDPAIAAQYLGYWTALLPDPTPGKLNDWVDAHSPLPATNDDWPAGTVAVFSPHMHLDALDRYAGLFGHAEHLLCMTLPFKLDERFADQLAGDHTAMRWLMFEDAATANQLRAAVDDEDTELVAGSILAAGGFRDWVEELNNPLSSNIDFIHTKFMLIDPLGDDPIVVTGSANFSEASTNKNDENMLVIRGEKDVADLYFSEFLRIFEHYRFRQRINAPGDVVPTPAVAEAAGHVIEDAAWYQRYYDEPARIKKRQVLAGNA